MRGITPPARERVQAHTMRTTQSQGSMEHSTEEEHSERVPNSDLRADPDSSAAGRDDRHDDAECGCVRSPFLRKLAYVADRWLLMDWMFVLFVAGLVGIVDQIEPWHKPLNELQLADVNIGLPYLPSIVSDALVICLSILMPPLIMLLLVYPCRRHHRGSLSELRIALLAFFTAVAFNLLATTITKKYVGRPRPNFVEYTGYFNRTYLFAHNKRDAFQSFPSGHASASFAGLGFLSMWAYANLVIAWRIGAAQPASVFSAIMGNRSGRGSRREAHKAQRNQLPLLGLCTLPLWLALWIALTRVRDHHHNSEDVLAGSVLGLAIAYWSYRAVYLGRAVEWTHRESEPQAAASIQPGTHKQRSSSSHHHGVARPPPSHLLLDDANSSAADALPEPSGTAANSLQSMELELLRQSSPMGEPSPVPSPLSSPLAAPSMMRWESGAGVWETLRSSESIDSEAGEDPAAAAVSSVPMTRLHI